MIKVKNIYNIKTEKHCDNEYVNNNIDKRKRDKNEKRKNTGAKSINNGNSFNKKETKNIKEKIKSRMPNNKRGGSDDVEILSEMELKLTKA